MAKGQLGSAAFSIKVPMHSVYSYQCTVNGVLIKDMKNLEIMNSFVSHITVISCPRALVRLMLSYQKQDQLPAHYYINISEHCRCLETNKALAKL